MAKQVDKDRIKELLNSPVGGVLAKAFAELYRRKPQFPVTYLAEWLKHHSASQTRRTLTQQSKSNKEKAYAQWQQSVAKEAEQKHLTSKRKVDLWAEFESGNLSNISKGTYPRDLLIEWFPEMLEQGCLLLGSRLTACYVGQLAYLRKKLEVGVYDPNSELDMESPKIVSYIGATKSHCFMLGSTLPREGSRSYEAFALADEVPNQEDALGEKEQEDNDQSAKQPKRKYLYVPQAERDDKIHYFRYPRLGSYLCVPMKVKSCLTVEAFDKGFVEYKVYLQNREEAEREHKEKVSEAKAAQEEAKKKWEDFEAHDDDNAALAEKAALEQEKKRCEQSLKEIEQTPSKVEDVQYQTSLQEFLVCCDTLGLDCGISQTAIDWVERQVHQFRSAWETKERAMLLNDIQLHLEEEPGLENLVNNYHDCERGVVAQLQAVLKEQHGSRVKQAEFQLSVAKCSRLIKLLSESQYQHSRASYLRYSAPKYLQIIQLCLLLLGHENKNINIAGSNRIDHRKFVTVNNLEGLQEQLEKYDLRRDHSAAVPAQNKITKLQERCDKIDADAVGRYNGWLYVLLNVVKACCCCRVEGRDAKIQAYEARVKAKNERDIEIERYDEVLEKTLEAAKAEQPEESRESFAEEEWRMNYLLSNPRPEPLQAGELQSYQDID